jgi:hypothetical protein
MSVVYNLWRYFVPQAAFKNILVYMMNNDFVMFSFVVHYEFAFNFRLEGIIRHDIN